MQPRSSPRPANALELVQPDQHVTGLGSVRRAEYAGEVQLIDDTGGAAVTNFEPPLEQ